MLQPYLEILDTKKKVFFFFLIKKNTNNLNHDLRGKKHFGIWMMILFVNSPKSIDPTLGKATKSNYIFSKKKKKKNNLVKIVEK